jgi:hypothetical protein
MQNESSNSVSQVRLADGSFRHLNREAGFTKVLFPFNQAALVTVHKHAGTDVPLGQIQGRSI